MDLFNILNYLNIVSLLVFFLLIIFIGYQVYLIKKEDKKNDNIVIPNFDEKNFQGVKNYTNLNYLLNKNKIIKRENNQYIYLLSGLSLIVLILFFLINSKINSLKNESIIIDKKNDLLVNKNNLNKEQNIINEEKKINLTEVFVSPTSYEISPTKYFITPTLTEIISSPTITEVISSTEQLHNLSFTISPTINQLPITADHRGIFIFSGSILIVLLSLFL